MFCSIVLQLISKAYNAYLFEMYVLMSFDSKVSGQVLGKSVKITLIMANRQLIDKH